MYDVRLGCCCLFSPISPACAVFVPELRNNTGAAATCACKSQYVYSSPCLDRSSERTPTSQVKQCSASCFECVLNFMMQLVTAPH